MHRLAMTSGGLAIVFFLVTLARCCCGSAFFGPAAPQHKFAQEDWPEVAVAAARANARVGTAMLHYPAELRQRRPAAQQLFLSTHKHLALPSLLPHNFLSPSTTSSTSADHCSQSGAAPAREADPEKPGTDPTDRTRPHRLHQPQLILHCPARPNRHAETRMALNALTGAAFLKALEEDDVTNIAIEIDKKTCSNFSAWHSEATDAVMIVVVQVTARTPRQEKTDAPLPAPLRTTSDPPPPHPKDLHADMPIGPSLPQELLDRNANAQLAGLEMKDLFPVLSATYYHKAGAWCLQTGAALAALILQIDTPLLTTGSNGVNYTLTTAAWTHQDVHNAKKQDTILKFRMRSAGTGKDTYQQIHLAAQHYFKTQGLEVTVFNQGLSVLGCPIKLFYGEFETPKVTQRRRPAPNPAHSPVPSPSHQLAPSRTNQTLPPLPLPAHPGRQLLLPVEGPRRAPHPHHGHGRRLDRHLWRRTDRERRHGVRRADVSHVLPLRMHVRAARPALGKQGQALEGTEGSGRRAPQADGTPAEELDPPPPYPQVLAPKQVFLNTTHHTDPDFIKIPLVSPEPRANPAGTDRRSPAGERRGRRLLRRWTHRSTDAPTHRRTDAPTSPAGTRC